MVCRASPTITLLLVLIITMHVAAAAAAALDSPAPATATSAAAADSVLELYMHDIFLGGSNPTARPITGLLGNIYNGQMPFARPLGFFPPKNGVPIPNANGAVPLDTGPSGTAFAPEGTAAATVPSQLGPDGLGLGCGTITVIDDVLTAGPELAASSAVGPAQGVYVASSADGAMQMMAFTAMMEGGEYGDSLNLVGV